METLTDRQTSPLQGQRILLGISGGIAAYKTVDLARKLAQAGTQVRCVLTEGATHFVSATALQAVTGVAVRHSLWDEAAEAAMSHIELARWADTLL
ncbi:MAG: bifunctional 4'-phosphopantothenoylcysteine decarboxylase/phosphopantothenoylcysteine synthetase, partial [Gammaproteobacteria bacterium]|nr:bifunctional 4'-phosphopantothenoylcysteine decarboxylase/phosphopantothenoylcysteine synthetase [Gammaproteobacteria bacterium]